MLDLAKVECAQFAACLNQDFEIVFPDGVLPVKLSEARPLGVRPESIREPFALTFVAGRPLRLSQGIYKMRNPQLGDMEIFLVQVAADANSSTFEAVFASTPSSATRSYSAASAAEPFSTSAS